MMVDGSEATVYESSRDLAVEVGEDAGIEDMLGVITEVVASEMIPELTAEMGDDSGGASMGMTSSVSRWKRRAQLVRETKAVVGKTRLVEQKWKLGDPIYMEHAAKMPRYDGKDSGRKMGVSDSIHSMVVAAEQPRQE